jgi:hypothetical protein
MGNGYGFCANEWLEDSRIKNELRLLIKISSLTAEKGFCYASNTYFAKYFNTTEVTISKQLSKLIKLGYINAKYDKRGAEVIKRYLRLSKTLTDDYQKLKPTIKENFKDNNISNNIISINILDYTFSDKRKEVVFKEWLDYRKEIKKTYKSKSSIKRLAEQFEKESYDVCKLTVDGSIKNGYQGLFFENFKKKKMEFEDSKLTATQKLHQSLGLNK